ncbi:HNH endonuclease [Vibrio maerlii]|uniref:HNH endonuclease n=1 Tax=Vibrio maerlii TaxID=2231648 RepID=UPI000E3D3C9A|nr:HNH endonuclease [Vibrio maerlii]
MDYQSKTYKEVYFWAYANLAMAHIALKESAVEYHPRHYGLRKKIYNDLSNSQIRIRSLFDDEKAKIMQSNICSYCGCNESIAIDHLLPRDRGGSDSGDNLIPACKSCNSSKSSKDMLSWVRARGKKPSILLYRRYLKLAISYCNDHNLMEKAVSSSISIPFDIEALYESEIPLLGLKLESCSDERAENQQLLGIPMRIANWNLERANNKRQLVRALEQIKLIDAAIIGLTELTPSVECPDYEYSLLSIPFESEPSDISAGIFSKWPIVEPIDTYDSRLAVCARIRTSLGDILVYVCIIPYAMSAVRGGKFGNQGYKPWQMHREHVDMLNKDWRKIQRENSDAPLIALGDFNQVRDDMPGGYGPQDCRDKLTTVLENNALDCLTDINFAELGYLSPDPKTGKIRRNIDHICVPKALVDELKKIEVGAWDHFNEKMQKMSDHNGTYVDLFID